MGTIMSTRGKEIEIKTIINPVVGPVYCYSSDLFTNCLEQIYYCEECGGSFLSPTYVYIIDCLKEAGLLPESYKKLCCFCYNRRKVKCVNLICV